MNSLGILKLVIATTVVLVLVGYTVYVTELRLTENEKAVLKLKKPKLDTEDKKPAA